MQNMLVMSSKDIAFCVKVLTSRRAQIAQSSWIIMTGPAPNAYGGIITGVAAVRNVSLFGQQPPPSCQDEVYISPGGCPSIKSDFDVPVPRGWVMSFPT